MRPISPSQIKAFRTCPRRFTYRYIEGIKEAQSAASAHGGAMHAQMEDYVLRGKTPRHAHALSAVPHAPRPLTALAERKVEWHPNHSLPRTGLLAPWSYLGIIDFTGVLLSAANMRLSPFLERNAPIMFGDYKFTSNLKYALEVHNNVLVDRETLKPDPQFAMYADYFYTQGYDDLTGKWIYTQTKNKTRTVCVTVRPTRDAVAEVMGGVVADAAQIHQLYTIRPKAEQVRYNRGGCNSFNQPCPHLSYCKLPRRSINIDDTEGDLMPGFAEALMSTFPGDPTDAPPIEGEEPPAIPDEDMPPIPEGDEEADRGSISEAEQLELINAELAKQRAERGTSEKGFVNPPEAPEVAPKTPEEAFERFGDPVPEKKKKEPARKFAGKDKPALLAFAIGKGLVEKGSRLAASGLAKLLKDAGHDPGAVVDNADVDGLPKESMASQANADQAAAYEIISQSGVVEETLELIDDMPPIPEDEGMVHEEMTRADLNAAVEEAKTAGIDTSEVEAELVRSDAEKKAAYELPVNPVHRKLRTERSTVARLTSVDFDHTTQLFTLSNYVGSDGELRMTIAQAMLLSRVLRAEVERIVGGKIFDAE